MRHRIRVKKLGIPRKHRKALLANLATAIFERRRIQTTLRRAKEVRKVVDRLITYAKAGTLHSRRLAARVIKKPKVLNLLFTEIAPQFSTRQGGYTRLYKLGERKGDNAKMALVELLTQAPVKPEEPEKGKATETKGVIKKEKVDQTPPRVSEEKKELKEKDPDTAITDSSAPDAEDKAEGH